MNSVPPSFEHSNLSRIVPSRVLSRKLSAGEVSVIGLGTFGSDLDDLNRNYFDIYFADCPFRNFHPPGCTEEFGNPQAGPHAQTPSPV